MFQLNCLMAMNLHLKLYNMNIKELLEEAKILLEASAMVMKPFSPRDFYMYAGAEKFEDGTNPLISSRPIKVYKGLEDAEVIHDAEGIAIIFSDGTEYFRPISLLVEADRILNLLANHETLSLEDLAAFRFKKR